MDNDRGCEGCGRDISHMRGNAKWCLPCAHEAKIGRNRRRFRDPSLREKLAAMILLHLSIPHDAAKSMTVEQALALVEWDHYPVASNAARDLGWTTEQANHPSNLYPRLPADHLVKTSKIDTPQAAKGKRLTRAHEDHRRRMLKPDKSEEPAPSKLGSRKLQGGGFRGHRKMDGTPVFKSERK